ncbi:MAG TPA: serine/threonine-protein kinase [Vicinamibacterales bacterium]
MGRANTPLPDSIGRFQIQEVLGRGGMGEVYKAFDPTLQRTVAVKTVRPDIDRPEYLERMMREAQACARLSHPNIVTVYEAGQADGVVFIAMEYLQGDNLADVLDTGSLSFEQKIRILAKVLEALHHAHGLDVVHRDIKPSNIHLCADGTIKLMDFGLARVLVADTLTASGNVLGTPHYASPEQLKGEGVDRRTDIYSTGVMAYEMLSGRRPFEPDNESISSVIIKVIQQPAAPMDTEMSRMLPEIESIVSRAMAKAPADRYQSADEMRQALLNFLETSKARITAIESQGGSTVIRSASTIIPAPMPAALPESAATRPSRRMWYAGGAAAAVLVGALLIAAPSRQMEEPMPASAAGVPGGVLSTPAAATPPAPAPAAPASTTPTSAAVSSPPVSVPATVTPPDRTAPAPTAAPRELGAKEMFASHDANVSPGLRFRVIQAGPNDAPMDVDPSKEFHTGDRIRFAFEANIDGYLYVAQQGASGNWTVLFPNEEINGGRNAVRRFEEYEVPQGDWFMLDNNVGTEHVFVFLSREPMKSLPGFERPAKSFQPGSNTLIAELRSSIQSRDLVFAKDSSSSKMQATYVVNKSAVGKAVTASFSLTHK